jgi:hypothetical protein
VITSRLFRTHFTIAAASILGCVFVGAWALSLVVQSIEALHEREHQRGRQPPFLYVNFIEAMSPRDATEGLKRLRKLQGPNDPIRFSLLDEKGAMRQPFPRCPRNCTRPSMSTRTRRLPCTPSLFSRLRPRRPRRTW